MPGIYIQTNFENLAFVTRADTRDDLPVFLLLCNNRQRDNVLALFKEVFHSILLMPERP